MKAMKLIRIIINTENMEGSGDMGWGRGAGTQREGWMWGILLRGTPLAWWIVGWGGVHLPSITD